jgi:hypothetical protein
MPSYSYTPTETLILEVLAARWRIGERSWTFQTRLNPQLNQLARRGLIYYKPASVEHAVLVSFTEQGYNAYVKPSKYQPPIFSQLSKKARKVFKQAWKYNG